MPSLFTNFVIFVSLFLTHVFCFQKKNGKTILTPTLLHSILMQNEATILLNHVYSWA